MAEATPTSYAGMMIRLAQQAETLRVHGEALRMLGPLAPPCLVRPYRQQREATMYAAGVLFAAFREQFGDAAHAKLLEQSLAFGLLVESLPDLIGSWSDAPDFWQPAAYDAAVVPIPREPIGGLGDTLPRVVFTRAGFPRVLRRLPGYPMPPLLRATEAVASQGFWRGLASVGGKIVGFAMRRLPQIFLIYEAADMVISGDSLARTLRTMLEQEKAAGIRAAVQTAILDELAAFEGDYVARTAQQWQAVIKIVRMSAGNKDLAKILMQGYDPHMEKPIPPLNSDFDVIMLGWLAGLETEAPRYSWLALPILVVGSAGTMVVASEG